MKQIIIIALVLCSIAARAQQKTDSLNTKADTSLLPIGTVTTATQASPNLLISGTQFPQLYTVNWAKVKTFADLKAVMQNINIYVAENATNFKKIKKYLIKQK